MPKVDSAFPGLAGVKAVDFNLSLVSEHSDVWRVEWTYQQVGATPSTAAGITDNNGRISGQIGFIDIGQDIRAEFTPAYRTNVTYPVSGNGTITYPAFQEVGGYSIDQAGTPISVPRRMVDIVVSETMDLGVANLLLSIFGIARFKRNEDPFLGVFPRGTVLYKGATIRRTGEGIVTVSHSFTQDNDFHLQQIAVQDQDGEALLNNFYQAERVYWVQPFNSVADFGLLSSNF